MADVNNNNNNNADLERLVQHRGQVYVDDERGFQGRPGWKCAL
jgi:hypothetical protein